MKLLKVSRTRNKVYVCRKCGDNYRCITHLCCRHDWILQNKSPHKIDKLKVRKIKEYCKKHHNAFGICTCPVHPKIGEYCPIGTPCRWPVEHLEKNINGLFSVVDSIENFFSKEAEQ